MKVFDECALPENVVPLQEEPENSDPQNTQCLEEYDEHDVYYSEERADYFIAKENLAEQQNMPKDGTFASGTEAGVTPGISPPAQIITAEKFAEAQYNSNDGSRKTNSGTPDVIPQGKDSEENMEKINVTDVSAQKGPNLQPIKDGHAPLTYDDHPPSPAPSPPPPRVPKHGVSQGKGHGGEIIHGTLVNAEAKSATVTESPSGKEEIEKTASRKKITKSSRSKEIAEKDSESLSTIQKGDSEESIILGTGGLGIGSLYYRITTQGHTRLPEVNLVLVPYLRTLQEPNVIL